MTVEHAQRAYELAALSLAAPEFKVLICLCFQADEQGQLELVSAKWASGIGYKPSAAKAVLASLQQKGLIERRARKLGRGKSDFTVITLSLEGYAKAQRKKNFYSGQMPKPTKRATKQAAAEQLSLSL